MTLFGGFFCVRKKVPETVTYFLDTVYAACHDVPASVTKSVIDAVIGSPKRLTYSRKRMAHSLRSCRSEVRIFSGAPIYRISYNPLGVSRCRNELTDSVRLLLRLTKPQGQLQMTGTVTSIEGTQQSFCHITDSTGMVYFAHRSDFVDPNTMAVGTDVECRLKLARVGRYPGVTDVVAIGKLAA